MFPRDQDPPEHGPRARLARRVWTLALGLLVEASALAIAVALLVVPAKLEAALGAPWKVESGLIVLALGTLTVIHLLHAWRTGAAACASGLPGLSCRAFACFAGAVWLAGAAVLALLPTLPTWLASSTPSSQSDTQMVKLILVLV
ncbi:hypothetical protein HY251_05565, partial [bacterium]|nr:hypothetical protein [bacterium]